MPDNNINGSDGSTSPAGTAAPIAAGATNTTNFTTHAPRPPSAVTSPPPARSTGGKRRIHPLWLVAGAVALFGLVFGIGNLTQAAGNSSAPSGTSIEETTISTIHTVDPSVVQIQARGRGASGGVGSGEILTTSGYIVTNSHVVHGFTSYTVLLASGQEIPATLVGDAPSQDLAVLKVNASNLTPIAVGDSSQVQVGEFAIALGSPLGLEQSATSGIISALNRQGREVVDGATYTLSGMIQTSAPINPGNSGGALVNLKGQLIGIPTLSAVNPSTGTPANGIGYAVTSNQMETTVRQLTGGAAG
ncbi:MAG TPA: trypsin-like peptidase domain-containing protein [Ktedonobacterales bacterium]|jgi:S1-C subfamily serine protease